MRENYGEFGRGSDRFEETIRARRERAKAHLERVRTRASRSPDSREAPRRPARVAVATFSVLAGALVGPPLASRAFDHALLDSIHVRGHVHLSPEEVARATGIAPGARRSDVDANAVAERVRGLPWVAEARAVELPLGGLVIDLVERVPLAVADAGQPASPHLVDTSGTPFAPATEEAVAGLPRLSPAVRPAAGVPDADLAAAAALLGRIAQTELGTPLEVGVTSGDAGLSLRLRDPNVLVLLGRDDLDAKLEALERLVAARPAELDQATEVDLRFADQAVLRSGPSPKGTDKAAERRGRAAPSNSQPSG